MHILKFLQNRIQSKPFEFILVLALLVRMIAAIFSRGFAMHDDHFLVIEPAQAWADGINYQGWLPGGRTDVDPDGHILLYSGLHYLLFELFNWLQIRDPQFKMLLVRVMHGLLSLVIVSLGFRITKKISGVKDATVVGLLLALLWFFPMLSVRNLVEIVCIPFAMYGIWILIKQDKEELKWYHFLISGIIMGLSFSIRFQMAVFIGGTGLALLLLKHMKGTVLFGLGVLLSVVPVQGLIDYFIWNYPFAEFQEYVRYNIEAAQDYITGPWYNYMLLLAGILIPPVSLFLLAGYFKLWRKQLLLWLPSFLFLLFHSVFPNKQERFIFPILPFILILGVVGWNSILMGSGFFMKRTKLIKAGWVFFWVVNTLLLVFTTVSYSKKSRVEMMSYLSRYQELKVVLLEDTNHESAKMVPQFYLGQWVEIASFTKSGLFWYLPDITRDTLDIANSSFVCFFEETNIENRLKAISEKLPELEYEATFRPGFIDQVMYTLNPVNLNQTIILYRNRAIIPNKINE